MEPGRIPFTVTGLTNGECEFKPERKRLSPVPPREFSGKIYQVCLTGGYAFTPINALRAAP